MHYGPPGYTCISVSLLLIRLHLLPFVHAEERGLAHRLAQRLCLADHARYHMAYGLRPTARVYVLWSGSFVQCPAAYGTEARCPMPYGLCPAVHAHEIRSVPYSLGHTAYVLWLAVSVLCLMAYVPWPMSHGLCPMAYASWPMSRGLCLMAYVSYVPWPMSHGLCRMAYVPWPMSHGLWPMADVTWRMAHGPLVMACPMACVPCLVAYHLLLVEREVRHICDNV